MKWLTGTLKKSLKMGYRSAVTMAKKTGNKVNMHIVGLEKVIGILRIKKTIEKGQDQNGLSIGSVVHNPNGLNYTITSSNRDGKCTLTAKRGSLEEVITIVASETTET